MIKKMSLEEKFEKLKEKNITFDEKLLGTPVRGVYGIFAKSNKSDECCLYIGRAIDIRKRCFEHFAYFLYKKNKKGLVAELIEDTSKDTPAEKMEISVRVLEIVEFIGDNYYRDLQRLAHAESLQIEKYQKKGEALRQKPEGSWIKEDYWERTYKNKS